MKDDTSKKHAVDDSIGRCVVSIGGDDNNRKEHKRKAVYKIVSPAFPDSTDDTAHSR